MQEIISFIYLLYLTYCRNFGIIFDVEKVQ